MALVLLTANSSVLYILEREKKFYLFSPHDLLFVLFTFWATEPACHQAITCFLIALDWPVCVAGAAHHRERAGSNQSCL